MKGEFSKRSLQRKPKAWDWDSRSVGRSSNRTAGVSLWLGSHRKDRCFGSSCRTAAEGEPMKKQPPVKSMVFVIDDDVSVRNSLRSLFKSVDLNVELFESTDDFLQRERPDVPCCLVLDVRLPGRSGLELQGELAEAGFDIPIIFLTGHGDIPMTVQAMKAGAVEFLTKPCRDEDLLHAVRL